MINQSGVKSGLISSGLGGDWCALGHLALFLEFLELVLGLLELGLECGIGMQAGHCDSACDASGINVALEMVTADYTALAHVIAALENFVLAFGIDFGKHECGGPSD